MSKWRTPESGHEIAGRYRLVEPLGRGGMGEVWRAEHIALRAPVAVKLIDAELLARVDGAELEEILARFEREAQAAALLRSPHVVHVMDHGVEQGVPYLVMELLEGETLEDRLVRRRPLKHAETLRILSDVGRAMSKAHKLGIVHRDLKPDNIFLVQNEDAEIAKVLDFGVAKLTNPVPGQGHTTRTGHLLGTPCYMSPEQAQGKGDIDARSDLWAMAVMAFECVCGYRPFESNAVGELVLLICAKPLPRPSTLSEVPPGFDDWWLRAADRDPEHRFQSARELVGALRAVLSPSGEIVLSEPGLVDEPSSDVAPPKRPVEVEPTRRPGSGTQRGVVTSPAVETRAPRRTAWIFGAIMLLIVVGGAFLLVPNFESDEPEPAASEPLPPPPEPAPIPSEIPIPRVSGSATTPASASASAPPAMKPPTYRPRPRPAPTAAPSTDRLGI
ncbi:MAG TPA: serine/threonine-protein kinase [Polyangiaceae bacterium]|nr:serine/threonine-protein kinase [Polyangiaceae bacterium]